MSRALDHLEQEARLLLDRLGDAKRAIRRGDPPSVSLHISLRRVWMAAARLEAELTGEPPPEPPGGEVIPLRPQSDPGPGRAA